MTLLSMVRKGRPEQGVYDTASRNGMVQRDTRCVCEGTDQRVIQARFNGPCDMPELGVHRCSQE